MSGARGLTIGHVVLSLDVGGLERVVATLARAQHASGARVVVYCLDRAGALAGPLPAAGVPVRTVERRMRGVDAGAVLRLARMLRADGVGVVHCHNHGAMIYAAVAARLAQSTQVVYTVHGAKTSQRKATARFLKLGLVREVVFVSGDARDTARAAGLGGDERVHTVVNGVDTSSFEGASDGTRVRRELSIASDAPVCGIVARLTPAKDHVTLLDAMVRLRASHPRLHCLVVGDGELRGDLERETRARALNDVVHFLGARGDIADCLAAIDVFVLSSVTEGLAMTLLEAMAAGKPIVATRVGGNPEAIDDGTTGLLVPPGDPAALAAAVAELLDDPARAGRMGAAGRARVRQKFSLEAMVAGYAAIYDRAAAVISTP
jgi:glycosyltransferase involved in cell wall biosynthesis